jgi:hypothetical protein
VAWVHIATDFLIRQHCLGFFSSNEIQQLCLPPRSFFGNGVNPAVFGEDPTTIVDGSESAVAATGPGILI